MRVKHRAAGVADGLHALYVDVEDADLARGGNALDGSDAGKTWPAGGGRDYLVTIYRTYKRRFER